MTDPTTTHAQAPLRLLLELSLEQAALKRRIDLVRDEVDAYARAELDTKGAAPTWKIKGLGQVRIDGYDPDPDPVPYVADEDEFATYVAGTQPTEVIAAVAIAVDRLDEAMEALGFAGVPTLGATVRTRGNVDSRVLANVTLIDRWEDLPADTDDKPEPRWVAYDDAGNEVTGVSARTGGSQPRLVVAVDRPAKAAAEAAVDAAHLTTHPDTSTATTDDAAAS